MKNVYNCMKFYKCEMGVTNQVVNLSLSRFAEGKI